MGHRALPVYIIFDENQELSTSKKIHASVLNDNTLS